MTDEQWWASLSEDKKAGIVKRVAAQSLSTATDVFARAVRRIVEQKGTPNAAQLRALRAGPKRV